ncbi:unnamed protein product [Anisakis simplex]|uniref:DNA_pol3_finger domain-containing protein n=1 Tax=Anisakis simplex TaxID=6269 RepID=A0A0M3JD21_ANISI|nr:unnamed protein product [Anisakis simplex]
MLTVYKITAAAVMALLRASRKVMSLSIFKFSENDLEQTFVGGFSGLGLDLLVCECGGLSDPLDETHQPSYQDDPRRHMGRVSPKVGIDAIQWTLSTFEKTRYRWADCKRFSAKAKTLNLWILRDLCVFE